MTALFEPPQPKLATGWEDILPDYSNIRGLNFVPTYPDLFEDPPDLPPPLQFRGVASPVAMWRFYDGEAIDTQLGYLKWLGCNAIRVWTSHPVWEHSERHRGLGENRFIESWVGFLSLCEKHRIHVMAVLWDELIFDQSPVPFDDIDRWTRSPSLKNTTLEWATDPSNPFNGDAYVRAVVEAGRHSRAIFMWDVMNEPLVREDFHKHYCDRIRECDPNPEHKITIGFAAHPEWQVNPLRRHPTHDVLSFHPYGMFRQNVEEWTRMARKAARPPSSDRPKEVIASEGGSPGEMSRYDKHFDFVQDLRLGLMPFMAMIGDPRGNMPFRAESGFFFHDGEVRNLEDAGAFQGWAAKHGAIPGLLPGLAEKLELRGFTPARFPNGFGVEEMIFDLHPQRWPYRPKLTDENVASDGYVHQRLQLTLLHKDLNWLSDVDRPRGVLTPQDQEILRMFHAEFELRDLFNFRQPWLTGSPLRIDWPRYDRFFTDWGIAIWEAVVRNELGA